MTVLSPVPAESAFGSSVGITAIGGVDMFACRASRSTISYSVGYFSRSTATAVVARYAMRSACETLTTRNTASKPSTISVPAVENNAKITARRAA